MRVLVTGGTGFTGSQLVRRLLADGHEVVVLDKTERAGTESLRDEGAEVVIGSVTDEGAVERCMEGVEVVHHVAAAFREIGAPDSEYYATNVVGTRIVADAAHRHDVRRMVHCSTCGVHGEVTDPPADEESPIEPEDYYQETKWLGEKAVLERAAEGLRAVVLRPTSIYGPGDFGRLAMLYRQVARGWFPMFGDGRTLYHTVFVENLVDAFLLAQDGAGRDGRSYLIADGQWCTIEELVRAVADSLGRGVRVFHLPLTPAVVAGHVLEAICRPLGIEPPLFPRRVAWFRHDRAFDIGRAREELGYEPHKSLTEGLRETARWYHQQGIV
ncbi:MAG: NAD-dependent epimerase/dehydratase family protein [Gemmatimonadota bacterium]|nr:NAD-dependent epimerase/dehydratase family protein [Gemmatimonadota bacterium]